MHLTNAIARRPGAYKVGLQHGLDGTPRMSHVPNRKYKLISVQRAYDAGYKDGRKARKARRKTKQD